MADDPRDGPLPRITIGDIQLVVTRRPLAVELSCQGGQGGDLWLRERQARPVQPRRVSIGGALPAVIDDLGSGEGRRQPGRHGCHHREEGGRDQAFVTHETHPLRDGRTRVQPARVLQRPHQRLQQGMGSRTLVIVQGGQVQTSAKVLAGIQRQQADDG
ncbi:hypothetical protein SDC9_188764 [bioreactor metagenome]|uniref:Uncharacterized protein n=1 Tax=bioreactor metagenome TaxID=1076179 RepID=A0A645HRV7_9ZZZZ